MEVSGRVKNASFKILADNVSSQVAIHTQYGGVYPMLAKREHIKNLPILLEKTLKEAKLYEKKKPVDVIAVTSGPGLEPALWTGITFAKELAKKWKVPLVPVNHMEGHVLSPFGKNKGKFKIKLEKKKFPVLALLVSGGHTQLIVMKDWFKYDIIGETRDDAVGEAFDKVARMLGLPYPGGPQISRLAEGLRSKIPSSKKHALEFPSVNSLLFSPSLSRKSSNQPAQAPKGFLKEESFRLPRPMLKSKDFDFSFSGLKTAVLYLIKKIKKIDEKTKAQIALEFENSAIECLTYKTAKAIEKYKIKTMIVAGGVAANTHLRNEMKKVTGKGVRLMFPTRELSTDNSIMIGMAGYLNYKKAPKKKYKIRADGSLRLGKMIK